ncbi:MAG: response regulator transcription factor [Planctomycetaceae bacterium]|nr:response regulator transcription factor [Planctomycetales bacterium]MCB9921056.1 response regulator transcription factor [Planctomycetaceae bacterium]
MSVKLLIADDSSQVRESLKLLLMREGIDVIEAATCQQAIRMASRLDLDAVLMDINMPDGSGLDVLVRIRQEHPGLPVLMHSEYDRPSYRSRSHALGAACYLVKGLNKEVLLEAIHQALSNNNVSVDTHHTPCGAIAANKGGQRTP